MGNRTEYAQITSSSNGSADATTKANVVGKIKVGVSGETQKQLDLEDQIQAIQRELADLEADSKSGPLDKFQNGLETFGLIPAFGNIPDVLNGAIYLGRGQWANAGFAFGSAVPAYGYGSNAAKYSYKSVKVAKRLTLIKKLKTKLNDLKEKVKKRIKEKRKRRKDKDCHKCASNPVYMPTGKPVYWDASFFISGLIPLNLQSAYHGDNGMSGPLGRNRMADIDATLKVSTDGKIEYQDSDAFPVLFERPTPNPEHWEEGDTTRGLQLKAGRKRSYILKNQGTFYTFKKSASGIWYIGKIEDQNNNSLLFTRNDQGQLLKIETPEKLTVLFDYNAKGLRTTVRLKNSVGDEKTVLRYAYDAQNNMLLSESLYGDILEYGYDEQHRRTLLRRNGQYEAHYAYDEKGRALLTKTNGPFNKDRFEYDERLKITTYLPGSDPRKLEKFYYNENNNVYAKANALGFISRTERNEENYISAEVDAEGNRTEYTYDHDGNIKSVKDGEGRTSFYVWDEDSNLEIMIDPNGNSWDYHYNEKGNLEAIEDANRFRTDISNNDQGLPVGVMRHDGLMRQYTYDEHHHLIASKDFNDATTFFERDDFGRITSVKNALGIITQFEYKDQLGQDFWSPYKTIFPDGATTEIKSGDDRNQISVIVSGKRKARYVYDAFGKLQESTDNKGANLTYCYDNQENLEKVINQQGQEWAFERDGANRVIREIDFDGQTFTYCYDQADKLIETTRNDGGRTTYLYDKSGLLIKEAVYTSEHDEPDSIKYEYDTRGLLTKAENSTAVIEFEYDANGQLITETSNGHRIESDYDCCGLRSERRVFSVEREDEPEDLLGISEGLRALAEMRGEGSSFTVGPQLQITQYLYDPLGELKQITMGDHKPLNIERDLLGRETSRASQTGFSQIQTHDLLNQLTGQQSGRWLTGLTSQGEKGVAQQAIERRYAWNSFAEPIAISDSKWGESVYQYDERGQISQTGFGDGFTEKFQYDAAQNIVASLDINTPETRGDDQGSTAYTQKRFAPDAVKSSPSDKFINWKSSKGGRVEKARGAKGEAVTLTYDTRGRVAERFVERNGFRPLKWKFVWDGRDRLTHTITPDGHKWEYAYDPFGRRLSKTQYILAGNDPRSGEPANRQWQAVSQHRFLWDGDQLIWEETSDERTEWYFEPDTFVPLAKRTVPISDELNDFSEGHKDIAAPIGKSGSIKEVQLWYVVTDYLGTPREILSEDGSLVWAAEYTTWGQIRRLWQADNDVGPLGNFQGHDLDGNPVYSTKVYGTDGNAALKAVENPDEYACPIRFQGQWADAESGLYYNRHRYYDPSAAQYLSPDPIGLNGGLRTHGYVETPTSWIDPFGLAKKGKGKKCCCDGRTYVKYTGIDYETGKPYHGYASAPGQMEGDDVVKRRYGGNFEKFGGRPPDIDYAGSSKSIARGLEQKHYERDGKKSGTANKQNPVGPKNARRQDYSDAADKYEKDNEEC